MTRENETTPTPYTQGYEVALIPPPKQPANPYAAGSEDHERWEQGYGDATDDMIRVKSGEPE